MKVAIFHELLTKLGGAERVVKIFMDIFPEAKVHTLIYDEDKVGKIFPKDKIVFHRGLQRYYDFGVPRRFLIGKMPKAIEDFAFEDYDLLLSSSSAFAHGLLTTEKTKHICYCHSPARYLWDQTFAVLREQTSRGLFAPIKKIFTPAVFHRLRIWDRVAANRPDKIIANSQSVQKRIKRFWDQESELVYPPVRTSAFTPTANHDDFFLIVSALSAFKNIDIAIEAFNQLSKHKLVIIGDGAEKKKLKNMSEENIIFLGRKTDEEVRYYMEKCRAFIFPGHDDFGIAPVEAMAAGKPVIALQKGGATETIIDGQTGLFFAEPSAKSLTQALKKFFLTEKTFDYEKIASHAKKFDEKIFIKKIKKLIADMV